VARISSMRVSRSGLSSTVVWPFMVNVTVGVPGSIQSMTTSGGAGTWAAGGPDGVVDAPDGTVSA